MDTGTSIQQEERFSTNDVKTTDKQQKGYRFTEPKISFFEEEYTIEGVESEGICSLDPIIIAKYAHLCKFLFIHV